MKNYLLLASLVLAAASSVFAQSNPSESPTAILTPESDVSVARGMTREAVTLMLGTPSETLSTNVWVYWNFKGTGAPNAAKYDTLILVFTDGRVSAMRLSDSKPIREMVARQKAKSAPKAVAAK